MSRQERFALVCTLLRELAQEGSWCGETHIQKAAYLAQEMLAVPFGFEFILYKHGPFSFDLRDEVTAMRADGFLRLVPQGKYGPTLEVTDLARQLENRFEPQVASQLAKIRYISQALGRKRVTELERIATAFFVTHELGGDVAAATRAERLVELKPHVDIGDAESAIAEIDGLLAGAIRLQ